jgi:LmbE family N-acetylglucosaminyl deacetylase
MGLSIPDLGTIASIWAHPDDETYLSGGIMAEAAARGQRVVCVSATAGERGTDDPDTWPPERLGRVRQREAVAAMAVLGVADHRFLGYPDGGMREVDPAEPVARLAGLFDEVAPDTVLTFGPDGATFHPDHQTISAWVGAAWRKAGRPGRLLHAAISDRHVARWGELYEQWRVYMSDERPHGTPVERLAVHLVLSAETLDRKVAALTAMHTQTAPALALMGADNYRAINAAEYFVDAPQP